MRKFDNRVVASYCEQKHASRRTFESVSDGGDGGSHALILQSEEQWYKFVLCDLTCRRVGRVSCFGKRLLGGVCVCARARAERPVAELFKDTRFVCIRVIFVRLS